MNHALVSAAFVLACFCAATRPAAATQVVLQLMGVVEQVSDASGLLVDPIPVGTQFTALIRYETEVPDFLHELSEYGFFPQPPGAAHLAIDVGGYHFESLFGGNIGVTTKNNAQLGWTEWGLSGPFGDQLAVISELSNPFPLNQFYASLSLTDSSGDAVSSDAIPLTVDLSDYDYYSISIYGEAKVGHENYPTTLEVNLRPTALTVVPEPTSARLLGAGALFVAWLSRRVLNASHSRNKKSEAERKGT